MWGYFNEKKQSAALTLEARIMNFLVLNPQVIPHRMGPSRQVLLGHRKKKFGMFFFLSTLIISISVDMLGRQSSRKKNNNKKKFEICSTLISISVMLGNGKKIWKFFFLSTLIISISVE